MIASFDFTDTWYGYDTATSANTITISPRWNDPIFWYPERFRCDIRPGFCGNNAEEQSRYFDFLDLVIPQKRGDHHFARPAVMRHSPKRITVTARGSRGQHVNQIARLEHRCLSSRPRVRLRFVKPNHQTKQRHGR